MSETRSHLTILRPRDIVLNGSARLTTDYLFNDTEGHTNQWRNRKQFVLSTLVLCLNLGSLWRFPKELLLKGSGSFLWAYVFCTFLIANSLVFFEVALGQYSSKGFTKVFAMCPLLEGVSYSMVFYCLTIAIFYNFINMTSFTYLYLSFSSVLPYQNCLKVEATCIQNSTNLTTSPEYIFFHHKILLLYEKDSVKAWYVNWKNIVVVFCLWILICVAMMRGIKKIKWFPTAFCTISCMVFIIILAVSLTNKAALDGMQHMFLPSKKWFSNRNTWRHAIEQSIINLSLGMGQLITYGSLSQLQSPAHIDSFYLSCSVTIISILSGMVVFGAVGILAKESGQEVEVQLMEYKKHIGIDFGVIYSQLFTRMPYSVRNFSAILFFFWYTFVGWYSLVSYTEMLSYAVFSSGRVKNTACCKIVTNIVISVFCIIIGSLLCFQDGYKYVEAFDKYVIGFSLVIIVFCELVGVIYIYGVFELCDDIEFMLGFYPNIFYQIIWICTPAVLLLFLFLEIYEISLQNFNTPDYIMCGMVIVFIVCPILVQMIYNAVTAYMAGKLLNIFYPREVILEESNDTQISIYGHNVNMYQMYGLSL